MKKLVSVCKLAVCLLSLSLILLCAGCSSGGGRVPDSVIEQELGVLAEKADKVTYRHNYDNNTKIDTVTVSLTYENDYCKSTVTSDVKYQYYRSGGLWDLLSRSDWKQDAKLKDFSKKENKVEEFADSLGYAPTYDNPRYYFNLDIGGIDTKSNTMLCEYYVEVSRYNKTKGHWNTYHTFASNGYENIPVTIENGGSVYVELEDPSSEDDAWCWLNPEDRIDPKLFILALR